MSRVEYLREVLSIQCEQAYNTIDRLERAGGISNAETDLVRAARCALATVRDAFRVVDPPAKEAEDGQ